MVLVPIFCRYDATPDTNKTFVFLCFIGAGGGAFYIGGSDDIYTYIYIYVYMCIYLFICLFEVYDTIALLGLWDQNVCTN